MITAYNNAYYLHSLVFISVKWPWPCCKAFPLMLWSLRVGCAGWCWTSTLWSRASANWPPCSAPCPPTRRTSSSSSPCWRACASRSTTRSWWDGRDDDDDDDLVKLSVVFFLFPIAHFCTSLCHSPTRQIRRDKFDWSHKNRWVVFAAVSCNWPVWLRVLFL